MLSRRFVLGAIIVGGISLLSGATTGSATAAPDETDGFVFGDWDLPTDPQDPGEASGVLYTSIAGKPLYLFKAVLTERGGPLSFRTGGIRGVLSDPNTSK